MPRVKRSCLRALRFGVFLISGTAAVLAQAPSAAPQTRQIGVGFFSGQVKSVMFAPDNRTLLYNTYNVVSHFVEVRVTDFESGRSIKKSTVESTPTEYAAFSTDAKLFAMATGQNEVKVGEVATGRIVQNLRGSRWPIQKPAFSPDGRRLAAATGMSVKNFKGGEVVLWDVESEQKLHTMTAPTDDVFYEVTFSPDGRLMATCGADNLVRLWDGETGGELRSLRGHNRELRSARFSPDGRLLATRGLGEEIKIWEVESGKELRTISVAPALVHDIAFSPDGRLLMAGTQARWKQESKQPNQGLVLLWEVESGREVRSWLGDKTAVTLVAFSPDGRRIAWTGYGTNIMLAESSFLERR